MSKAIIIAFAIVLLSSVSALSNHIDLHPRERLTVTCNGRVLFQQMDTGVLEISCVRNN